MTNAQNDFDVAIIGAGPAGLSLARALAETGLRIAVVERSPRATLENPPFDGREIALTHHSAELLKRYDAWHRIPPESVSPMLEARVLNGPVSMHALRFQPPARDGKPLSQFVPNYLIRRALYESVALCESVQLLTEKTAASIDAGKDSATLALTDGKKLTARLIVAADTRFSEMRRRMGIPARMRDFGKTMMVCRIAHDKPHNAVATEWFGYGQTVAILPLNGTEAEPNISSLVLTLPGHEIERLMAMDTDAFGTEITERYQHRLGTMRPIGSKHPYPLVVTYADRFAGRRFALLGDAAVGMHPVTAHGFNMGLQGAETLSGLIANTASSGGDIGAPSLLARYEMRHRRATKPLYLATNATASLYTDDRFPARVVRDAAIRAGELLTPVRRAVAAQLMSGAKAAAVRRVEAA
jgi:ubiquinone biosynthesis UbiH/UbiF/VisC/COQ6 family hydroxylase